jgi:pimeloyl-ACP methyl ester carboxylesterase
MPTLTSADGTRIGYERTGAGAREVEDLRAFIAQAGGEAYVYAISSGGPLAVATAAADPGVTRLAVYEPPFLTDGDDDTRAKQYTERLRELLAGTRSPAEHRTLDGQTHDVAPDVLASVLVEFFGA